jgi:hypothetical protein
MIASWRVWDPGPDSPSPEREAASRSRVLRGLSALATMVVFAAVLTSIYVGSERTFYCWDQAVFHDLALSALAAFQSSPSDGLRDLTRTLGEDYNALFALPLVPFLGALGDSRLAYELGLALLYVVPFALAVGGLGAAMIRGPRAGVFWSTTALTLLTPMTWVPGFRGYPDAAAALAVALATAACLEDPGLRRPRTVLVVGALLAAAVLLRRHFLFAAPALLGTVGICGMIELLPRWREPRRAVVDLATTVGRVLLTGAAGLAFAFAVGRPVMQRLFGLDFFELYSAYLNPPRDVASWFLQPYGWLFVLGAIAGFVLGGRSGVLEPRAARFLAVFGAASIVQWVLVVRQVGEQYTFHFTPPLVLGLAGLGWHLGRRRALLAVPALVLLAVNLFLGLGSPRLTRAPFPLRSLFAANWQPLVREDGLGRMVEELRRIARPGDPIFVAASSLTANPDLLTHAERALYGRSAAHLSFPNVPAVDSRDQYPIEALLRARYVVQVTPLQTHLGSDQQKVVGVVHDLFSEGDELAADFRELSRRFSLQGGATAVLFERRRPTSFETGLSTLAYVQGRFATPPGLQPDWVVVSQYFPSWTSRRPDGSTHLVWHPAPPGELPAPVAVYLAARPPRLHVSGRLHFTDRGCAGAALTFSYRAADGSSADVAGVARRPEEPESFTVSFPDQAEHRLLLRLEPRKGQASVDACLVEIDSLAVVGAPR